ncbi:cupin domain-containing protein [Euzebya sp.]|uniref:cupin domain-containing protein n=1 Tax=Euzebya sp. TaxID=1971409 RepID=UPI003515BEED
MAPRIITETTFDPDDYAEELEAAPGNLDVGTKLNFENEAIRVWEVKLEPGERGPFHAHTRRYFWTVVDGGIGRQRTADGTMVVREYHEGDTNYSEHTADDPTIHDFENYGDTVMRFVTVELLD